MPDSISRKHLLIVAIALAMVIQFAFIVTHFFITTEVTPNGIVSVQFIESVSQLKLAMLQWGHAGDVAIGLSMGLDFFYIPVYVLIFYIGLNMTAEKIVTLSIKLAELCVLAARGLVLAGVLDCIENIATINVLLGSDNALWILIMHGAASVKYFLLGSGIGLLLLAWAVLLKKRLS